LGRDMDQRLSDSLAILYKRGGLAQKAEAPQFPNKSLAVQEVGLLWGPRGLSRVRIAS
jgi:hypothetical protein